MSKNCVNCFAPLGAGGVCPNCGFNNAAYQPKPYLLPPGTVLRGRYVIGMVLGEGGFGITYAGYDPVLSRRIAIKEYYPSGAVWREPERSLNVNCPSSGNFTETFRIGREKCIQEAKSLASLDDIPAIVRVIDFFEENNTAYILMEFVEGVTLRSYARKQPKKLTLSEIVGLLAPVTDALEKIHKRGFVHRDVSPDNIMITADGAAKLLDFGAVKHMSSSDGTMTQNPIVKRGFSPLELYSTSGRIGPWTDVYAFAATIYYLLVGQPLDEPADRLNDDTAAEKLNGVLPQAQTDAMLRALAIQYKSRQSSVRAFVDELTAAGQQPAPVGEPENADEKTEIVLAEEPPRRSEPKPPAPGGDKETKLIFDDVPAQPARQMQTAPLSPAVKQTAPVQQRPPAAQQPQPAPKTQKKSPALIAAAVLLVIAIIAGGGWFLLGAEKKGSAETVAAATVQAGLLRVVDEAELFTEAEEKELNEKITAIIETYSFDVVIVTVTDLGGKSAEAYADDYYDHNNYGCGRDRDGCLLLIKKKTATEDGEFWISTNGSGIKTLNDSKIEKICNDIVPSLKTGDYAKACGIFVDDVSKAVKKHR